MATLQIFRDFSSTDDGFWRFRVSTLDEVPTGVKRHARLVAEARPWCSCDSAGKADESRAA
jgi:hypothetical protein